MPASIVSASEAAAAVGILPARPEENIRQRV
jgi:hypothetical protein